jgi:hypothetical protein
MSLTTTGDRANSENILTKDRELNNLHKNHQIVSYLILSPKMHRSAFKEGLKSSLLTCIKRRTEVLTTNLFVVRTLVLIKRRTEVLTTNLFVVRTLVLIKRRTEVRTIEPVS